MDAGNDRRLRLPGDVQPGEPVKASEENQVREGLRRVAGDLRSRTPVPSADHGVKRSAGGFSIFQKQPVGQWEKVVGLQPVSRSLGSSGVETPGVGMVPGIVHFLHVITTVAGDLPRIVEQAMPTLNGTRLDADPPPREALAAGEYSAWVVYSPYVAEVQFLGVAATPAGVGDRQRAVRVAQFEVTLPSDPEVPQIPKVRIMAQEVRDEISAWMNNTTDPDHPFKITMDGDDIAVSHGVVDGVHPETYSGAGVVLSVQTQTSLSASLAATTLSADRGVWVRVSVEEGEVTGVNSAQFMTDVTKPGFKSLGHSKRAAVAIVLLPQLEPGDVTALNTATEVYFYIGKVESSGGSWDITQWRRSDIVVPPIMVPAYFATATLPGSAGNLIKQVNGGGDDRLLIVEPADVAQDVISTEDPNGLSRGNDDLLRVDPADLISADAPGLATGVDDKLKVDENDVVTGLTPGGGITVSDNGDGTWEVSD